MLLPGTQNYVNAQPFQEGQAIGVQASGADVGTFETSVTAPMQATVTSRFDQTTLAAGQPLILTWSPATSGVIRVRGFYGTDGDSNYLDCPLDGASGTGTISAAAIAGFGGGILRLYAESSTRLHVSDWDVDVSITFDALWSDGTFAQGLLKVD
jgi:hypothetical protein